MPFSKEFYETEPPKVKIIQDGSVAHVWLSKDIEKDVADATGERGTLEFWTAQTLYYKTAGTPTVEEVEADFDAIVARVLESEKTTAERLAELEQDNADLQAALLELGDLIGGEE